MELTRDFLKKDYCKAMMEYACIIDCLDLLEEALDNSDYDKASVMAENMGRSLKELGRLHENKLQMEKIKSIIVRLDIDLSKIEGLGK